MDGKVSERLKDTGCEWIRVCWCGLNGAWKCKTVHVGIVEQLHKRGVGLTRADPGLLLALDAIAYGDPVGEVRLLPDWSTLRALPYSRGHVAVCANVDWELDARCFLRRMVARLETEHKLRLRAAFEEEVQARTFHARASGTNVAYAVLFARGVRRRWMEAS